MKIDPNSIGFDIDCVVADTLEAFIRLARDDYGVTSIAPADITEFEVEDCLDIDPEIVEGVFTRLMEEPLAAGLKPMAGAIDVLEELAQASCLTFITARPSRDPIEEWLRVTLGTEIFEKVRLVAMGQHDLKAGYIREMGLHYFVDDRAQTCLKLHEEGIIPIVYAQPWNHGKHDLMSVDSWFDIRSLCFN